MLNKPGTEVDIELHQRTVAGACEAVNLARLDDENVSRARLEFLALDDIAAAALPDELDLVIGMPVRFGTAARLPIKKECGDAHIALIRTDEIVRAAALWQILLADSVHVSSSVPLVIAFLSHGVM
jgi:hypothetical protein